ncbi:jg13171 [Pararge aegeria aegeria]|uniref:Jg13171 protein n=1 Tax=Pararge aegeria aegeria TaxID=348720 RepID=A0A8S4RZS0_9NEOP|nr:jg13171 [Pararge aegeria aegeria]
MSERFKVTKFDEPSGKTFKNYGATSAENDVELKGKLLSDSVLDKTRTRNASFSNGVVFPGGVSEEADASDHWLHLLNSFGFGQNDFEGLHRPGAFASPIFASNPIRSIVPNHSSLIGDVQVEPIHTFLTVRHSKDLQRYIVLPTEPSYGAHSSFLIRIAEF